PADVVVWSADWLRGAESADQQRRGQSEGHFGATRRTAVLHRCASRFVHAPKSLGNFRLPPRSPAPCGSPARLAGHEPPTVTIVRLMSGVAKNETSGARQDAD